MQASVQDRLLGGLGAAIIVGLLGYGLITGMSVRFRFRGEPVLTLLDLRPPPPPRRRPEPRVLPPKPARKASGRAAPRNLRNKPTEVVALPPLVSPPVPPLVTAPRPGEGMAAAAGASDQAGPGDGAGGRGDGTGSGGEGDGDGGGDLPPRLVSGRLKFGDLPPELRDAGVGGTVSVRYRVEVDGRASGCIALVSSGNAELDLATCRLIEARFRFRPSRDPDGRPVRSLIEESHSWLIERDGGRPPG